jgi:hypothetical protein
MFITSRNLNHLEAYGPVQACVRIVLLLGDQRVGREIIGQETNLALPSPFHTPALSFGPIYSVQLSQMTFSFVFLKPFTDKTTQNYVYSSSVMKSLS